MEFHGTFSVFGEPRPALDKKNSGVSPEPPTRDGTGMGGTGNTSEFPVSEAEWSAAKAENRLREGVGVFAPAFSLFEVGFGDRQEPSQERVFGACPELSSFDVRLGVEESRGF